MNILDILILIIFAGVIAAGFFVGIGKAISAIVATYFATVMSATFYQPLGDLFKRAVPDINESTASLLAFVLLFIFASIGIGYVIIRTVESMSQSNRFVILNNIGGAALGGIVAAVTITLSITVTVILVQALAQSTASAADGSLLSSVGSQIRGSALAPVFLDMLPYVTRIVEPWFPGGLPPILTAEPRV
jgi:uncharacterized membrane protein required for colicin V production